MRLNDNRIWMDCHNRIWINGRDGIWIRLQLEVEIDSGDLLDFPEKSLLVDVFQ